MVLPLSGVATILSARILTGEYGTPAYALFTLIASIPSLLPIADFGLGAAVTNSAAALPTERNHFRSVLKRTRNILIVSGISVSCASVLLGLMNWWPAILGVGQDADANIGASAALAIYGLSIPLSLGARVLIGLRRNAVVVVGQGVGPLISLGLLLLASQTRAPLALVLSLTMAGPLLVSAALSWIAAAYVRRLIGRRGQEKLARVHVWRMASATLVLTLALPLTFQAHRLMLSLLGNIDMVAIYSAAAIVFFPVLSVIQMAGQSLWGDFAQARHANTPTRPLLIRGTFVCLTLGLGGSAGLILVGPLVAKWATNGLIDPPLSLFVCFSLIILAQSIHITAGMFLTDEPGMRFQAITSSAMAAASVVLGAAAVPLVGVSGPVIATAAALTFCHALPCQIRAFRASTRVRTSSS